MRKHWLIGGLAGVFALGRSRVSSRVEVARTEREPRTRPSLASPSRSPTISTPAVSLGRTTWTASSATFSAERSVDAGIPSVATCWGCHIAIPGTNNPQEVAKIQGYVERDEPIPWVRIYKIADHAHFPHMRHMSMRVSNASSATVRSRRWRC